MKVHENKADYISLTRKTSDFNKVKISCSSDAAKYVEQFYHEDKSIFESFFILMLDRGNMVQGYAKISQGGVTGTVVDVKIIAKYALDTLASGLILAHNHPSGNMQPSEGDKKVTTKVKNALQLLDVNVLDHIIISGKNSDYYSLNDNGEM